MNRYILLVVSFLLCFDFALAQSPEKGRNDGIPDALFSMQLVKNSKDKIDLTPQQENTLKILSDHLEQQNRTITKEIKKESDDLKEVLSSAYVDEKDAKLILYRILDLERQLKMSQVLYLIRIKNTLTEAQQKKLSDIREEQREGITLAQ